MLSWPPGNRFDDWFTWSDRENRLPPGRQRQRERWHLACMHSKPCMDMLVDALVDRACDEYPNAKSIQVSASSNWIDKKPQAFWGNPRRNVELADLLVVVTRKFNSLPPSRHAVLLQGKCVDRPDRLNTDTCRSGNDSTLKERDLLESNSGEIELVDGSRSLGKYDLPAERISTHGIGDFARYLLIPTRKSLIRGRWSYPYLTLWPSSRRRPDGARAYYSQLLCDMTGLASIHVEPRVRAIKARSEWERLVDDLLRWAKSEPDSTRFSGFPVAVSAQRQLTRHPRTRRLFISRVIDMLRGALPLRWRETLVRTLDTHASFAVPPGGKRFPPDTRDEYDDAEDGQMMLIVEIELAISDSDRDERG